MIFIGILFGAVLLGIIIGLLLRKKVFKKVNLKAEEFLNKKNTTLEKELQDFIDTTGSNMKLIEARIQYTFKYKSNECTCIIVKFRVEGKKDWYIGIVSDSGSYTEFKKFNLGTNIRDSYSLLSKIYKQPALKINDSSFTYLSKLDNIYNFNIKDENIIFNSKIKKFRTDYDIVIGVNASMTMTDKNIYISNGIGMWVIDLYNDISNYKRNDMCMIIDLSEICLFGQAGERMCTGYKLFFDNKDNLDEFERILNNVIK